MEMVEEKEVVEDLVKVSYRGDREVEVGSDCRENCWRNLLEEELMKKIYNKVLIITTLIIINYPSVITS